jgi:alpha/beta superfamily hydrolase
MYDFRDSIPIMKFPLEKKRLFLQGPAGKIEVAVNYPADKNPKGIAIICHPHPLHGGTMDNKVVTTLARAYENLNWATVRFNFRGVGDSEGVYDHTIGETEDLFAVIEWIQTQLPHYPISLAGFSFGAYIAANAANQISVAHLISVAPAVHNNNFKAFTYIQNPWLMIIGDQDELVPVPEVKKLAEDLPIKLVIFQEATHFFHGKLVELKKTIIDFLNENDSQLP